MDTENVSVFWLPQGETEAGSPTVLLEGAPHRPAFSQALMTQSHFDESMIRVQYSTQVRPTNPSVIHQPDSKEQYSVDPYRSE